IHTEPGAGSGKCTRREQKGVRFCFCTASRFYPSPRALFQELFHLLPVESEDKFVPDPDYRSPQVSGLLDYHISCLIIGSEIDLLEPDMPAGEVFFYLVAVMAPRG